MKWLVLFTLITSSSAALASPANPQSVVEGIFTTASAPEVISDKSKQEEINAKVDYDTLAKSALGKNFKSTSASDFAWFRDTLSEIITRTVFPKAPDFLKGVKISYDEIKEKGNRATVKSTVQNKADLTDVSYVLEKDKSGEWKVVDVSISGQSWVESIRDQVTEVLKKKKWKGLKDSMSKRLADLKAGKV